MTIEAYIPKHAYFSTSLNPTNIGLEKYENAKVLELYGNAGTLLNDPENKVKEENYTVFDSDQEAIDQGKEDFPNADFRMWNRHNQMNNPSGNIDEPMPFEEGEMFDCIFSYMKTANVDTEILIAEIQTCYSHLNPGGAIVFGTFIREVALNYFVVRRTHEYGALDTSLIENTENCDVFCLINNDDIRVDVDRVPTSGDDAVLEATHFTWFWNNNALVERLKIAFPDATIHTRRLPPMWTLQNPLVIEKPE